MPPIQPQLSPVPPGTPTFLSGPFQMLLVQIRLMKLPSPLTGTLPLPWSEQIRPELLPADLLLLPLLLTHPPSEPAFGALSAAQEEVLLTQQTLQPISAERQER